MGNRCLCWSGQAAEEQVDIDEEERLRLEEEASKPWLKKAASANPYASAAEKKPGT